MAASRRPGTSPLRGGAFSLTLADFNQDGKPDLAVLDTAAGGVHILLGQSNGRFARAARAFHVGGPPMALAVGDFNRDGKPDLAIVRPQSNSVAVLLNSTM